jgi:hypothetical protein
LATISTAAKRIIELIDAANQAEVDSPELVAS